MHLPEALPARSLPFSKRRTIRPHIQSGGFTLLEVATVIVILGILGTLTVPVVKGFRERAEGLKCMANLKGLSLGVQAYIVDHRCWPQISNEKKETGASDAAPLSNSAQIFAENGSPPSLPTQSTKRPGGAPRWKKRSNSKERKKL